MTTHVPSRSRRITLALHLMLIVAFAGIGFSSTAQGIATITTDYDDYPPGATVFITGSGFAPGETVILQVIHVGEDPGLDPDSHMPWTVSADGEGNVVSSWYVPIEGDALGATFLLTADGQLSGSHAEWTFTDGTARIFSVSETIISPANIDGVKDNTSIIGENQGGGPGGGVLNNFTIKIHSTTSTGPVVRTLYTVPSIAGNTQTPAQVWNGQNDLFIYVPDGIYFAVAGAGGIESADASRVKQITVDNTPPTVTLIAPGLPSILPNTSIAFSATPLDAGGNDSNIEKVEFYIDNILIGTDASSNGGGWNFTLSAGKPLGTYTWSAKTYDFAGNSATASRTLTVGKATPTFTSLTASQSITYGTASITLNGTIIGTPEPTGTITVTINGVTQNTIRGNGSSSNQFSVTFPTSTLGVTGSPYTITYSYPGDANYNDITDGSTTLTVTPKAITVTAANATKLYGAVDPPLTYSAPSGSLAPGDGLSGSLIRAAGQNVGTYAITQDPSNLITIDPASSIPNYVVNFVPGSLSITAAPLTITAEDKSKVYDGLVYTPFTVAYSGFVNGDDENDLGGTLTFSGSATTNTSFGNNYKIVPAGLTSGNYSITFEQGTLNITRRPISIIVNSLQTKVYGDVNPIYSYSVGGDGLAVTDEFTGALARAVGENVGSYAINQGTLTIRNSSTLASASNNYTTTFTGANFTITPLGVTVTADAKAKTYGAVDPALTFVSSPAVGSALANGLLISFTGSLTRATGEDVGPYAINQGSVDNSNYTIAYSAANLTINPLGVTVTADAQAKTYGDLDPALTFVSSPAVGFVLPNGLPISFTGSLTRVAGENVGPYAINQGSVDNSNYTITYSAANLTINPLGVSVTADAKSKTYGDLDPALTFVSSPAVGSALANGLLISFSGSLTRDAGENVGNYAITQGTVANSNYTIAYAGANLTINQLGVAVTADAKSKTYGDLDPALTFVSNPAEGSALANGLLISFSGSLTRDAGENVGNYAITQGTVANSNYTIAYTGANLTINQLGVAVTADAKSKTYGDLDPALTFVSNPTEGSALANGLLISFSGSLTRDAGENVGNYAITQGTVANSNYTIAYTGANLTINQLGVAVTADAKSKTYGDLDPALTFVSSPAVGSALANGLLISFSGSLTRDAGENVGNYAITQGTVANSNYTIAYAGANLTINQLGVAVTADAKSKTYGDLDPALTFVSSPAVGSALANGETISFTGSLIRVVGENVGAYAINKGTVDNSNYAITYIVNDLTITPLGVTVTGDPKTKTYGNVDPALTFVSSPAVGSALANGLTISFTGSLTRVAGEDVGNYAINQGSVANSNYTIAYTGANLTISPASLTITANNRNKYCGQLIIFAGTEFSVDGLKFTDAVNSVTLTSAGAAWNALASGSPYSITPSSPVGTGLGNYTIGYVNGSLSILAVSIDASANSNPQPVKSTSTVISATITPAVADVYVTFKVDGVVKGTSQTNVSGVASFDIGVLPVEVYKIEVTAGADCSNSIAYLPVYDPTAGFVTGGGWFISPIVTSLPAMQVSGKANFGFVSKYLKGSNTPTGNTEFQFQAGNVNFASSSYNLGSLVVATSRAIYKGVGTINGGGNYGFMVSVIDGQVTGGGGIDKFRIKIWDKSNGDAIVYDNNNGLDENGLPTIGLGGGSIVIHAPNGKNSSAREANEAAVESTPVQLDETIFIEAYPNPMKSTLSVKVANPANEAVAIQMMDVAGRTMWMKQPESTTEEVYTIDTNQWPSGLYILQVKVGRAGKTMKLLKE